MDRVITRSMLGQQLRVQSVERLQMRWLLVIIAVDRNLLECLPARLPATRHCRQHFVCVCCAVVGDVDPDRACDEWQRLDESLFLIKRTQPQLRLR